MDSQHFFYHWEGSFRFKKKECDLIQDSSPPPFFFLKVAFFPSKDQLLVLSLTLTLPLFVSMTGGL